MIQVSPVRVRLAAGMICALLFLGWASPAPAQIVRSLTFKQLVDQSDVIFTATVAEKKSEVVNRRIYTRYKLKSPDFWKGQVTLSSANDFEMVEAGGHLTGPVPIAQYVPGTSQMMEGENVLLFCGKPQAQAQLAGAKPGVPADPRMSSLHVMGAWQGRFSVFSNPESGQKLVAKATASAVPGAPMNPALQKAMIAQSKQVATANAVPTAPVAPGQIAVGSKDLAKQSVALNASQPVAAAMAQARAVGSQITAEAAKAQAARATLAASNPEAADEIFQYEPLDDVKARVQRVLGDQKK